MEFWLPKLQQAGVLTPTTTMVEAECELDGLLDGRIPDKYGAFIKRMVAACDSMGYPCFVRTAWFSGKHRYRDTCLIPARECVHRHIAALVEESALVDIIGLPTHLWAVRKFLDLAAKFQAFHGLPIGCERRYFLADGEVRCHHPYWPPDAIAEAYHDPPLPDDWLALLDELSIEDDYQVADLIAKSRKVARCFKGSWSLDWARDKTGTWWAIDMAPGDRSWHPPCRHGIAKT